MGLGFCDLLRLRASATEAPGVNPAGRKTNCIMIWLDGGPSHYETFDPKPDAPEEIRGTFKSIPTCVSGVHFSETVPELAKCFDKYTVIRSICHRDPNHGGGNHYMMTGSPTPVPVGCGAFVTFHPSFGSMVSYDRGVRDGLPAYMAMPSNTRSGGPNFLGGQHAPFVIGGSPNAKGFQVRDVVLPSEIAEGRAGSRRELRTALDRMERFHEKGVDDPAVVFDEFYHQGFPWPGVASDSKLELSEIPELMAADPDDPSAANPLTPPFAVTGAIDRPRREDRIDFFAVKGRAYSLAVTAGRIGSTLEPWLKLEDKNGKRLARNEGVPRDLDLAWTAPADGVYTAVVGEVTHRGGPDYLYRLAIAEAVPSASANLEKDSSVVVPGKPTELKISLKRLNGFKAPLQLLAQDLPPGVTAPPVEMPAKDGDVTLKLNADPDAAAASQPFHVILRETESGAEHVVPYHLNATAENNGVPQGYSTLVINSTDQPWITVKPAPAKK